MFTLNLEAVQTDLSETGLRSWESAVKAIFSLRDSLFVPPKNSS
jgi:hypothetical protein